MQSECNERREKDTLNGCRTGSVGGASSFSASVSSRSKMDPLPWPGSDQLNTAHSGCAGDWKCGWGDLLIAMGMRVVTPLGQRPVTKLVKLVTDEALLVVRSLVEDLEMRTRTLQFMKVAM